MRRWQQPHPHVSVQGPPRLGLGGWQRIQMSSRVHDRYPTRTRPTARFKRVCSGTKRQFEVRSRAHMPHTHRLSCSRGGCPARARRSSHDRRTPGSARRRDSRPAAATHPDRERPVWHLGPLVRRWVRRGVCHTVRGQARPRRLRCGAHGSCAGRGSGTATVAEPLTAPVGPQHRVRVHDEEPPGDAASYGDGVLK